MQSRAGKGNVLDPGDQDSPLSPPAAGDINAVDLKSTHTHTHTLTHSVNEIIFDSHELLLVLGSDFRFY